MTNKQGLNIHYRNKEAVEFIEDYPNILPFIKRSAPYLIKHFGSPLDIELEVMSYLEEDELVAWIQSGDEVEATLDKLGKFDDEWFLDRMEEVDYRFNFNIGFKEGVS